MEQFAEICKNLAIPLSIPLQLVIVGWLIVIDRRSIRTETKLDILLKNGKTTTSCIKSDKEHNP